MGIYKTHDNLHDLIHIQYHCHRLERYNLYFFIKRENIFETLKVMSYQK